MASTFLFGNDTFMTHLNNKNNNKNSHPKATATTISFLAIVIILVSISIVVFPTASATTTTTTTAAGNTTTTSSSGIKLSSQPIYQKHSPPGNIIPINQTYIGATHTGNGTLTLPDSTQGIKFTAINGTALISLATPSVQIRETLRAENGEIVNVTGYEIIQLNNPAAAPQGGGKSIVTAILQTNPTGMLAPLNGVILAGIDNFASDGDSRVTLWKWESGIPLASGNNTTTVTEQSPSSSPLMNTNMTNATTTASDINATAVTGDETLEEEAAVGGAEEADY